MMVSDNQRLLLESIKDLVGKGELSIALDQLGTFLKEISSHLYNEVLLHSSKLNHLRRNERLGLISSTEAANDRARITYNLLEFLEEIPKSLENKISPIFSPPVNFSLPEDTSLEKIFGVNHLKSIAWLEQGLNVAKSVCRVVTPDGIGTGFLIEDNYIMTNNHVMPTPEIARKSCVEFNYQEDMYSNILPKYTYKLDCTSFKTNKELDYSVTKVLEDSNQPTLGNWGSLQFEENLEPNPGDHVTIIQHPNGGVKQIALTANQVVNIFDYRLQYMTDTLPGSSGAPVFNDNWKIIAIHHAGGNLLANKAGERRFANEGILVFYILKDLNLK